MTGGRTVSAGLLARSGLVRLRGIGWLLTLWACGSSQHAETGAPNTGGTSAPTSSVGGTHHTGGAVSGGFTSATGGAIATGGSSATGGTFTTTGGASGGTLATGGVLATEGTLATGGVLATGSTLATGGVLTTGGTSTSGDAGNPLRWAHVVAPGAITGVAVTTQGTVYIAGSISKPTDLQCGSNVPAAPAAAAASFALADGHCRWASSLNSVTTVSGTAVALGPDDIIYVAGDFADAQPDFGGGTLPWMESNYQTPYVGAFHDTGTGLGHIWSISFPGDGYVRDLAGGTTPTVVGEYTQYLTVNGQWPSPCCTLNEAVYVVHFDETGQPSWIAGARSPDQSSDRAVAFAVAESNGTVLTGGLTGGQVKFGTTSVTVHGSEDAYVAAYDASNGNVNWIKTWGAGSSSSRIGRILAEPAGTFLVAGTVFDGADLGQGPIGSGTSDDYMFIERLKADGTLVNLVTLHVNSGYVFGLDRRSDGRIVLFATYRTTLNIAGKTLVPENAGDPFLAILSPDLGTWEYAEAMSTPGEDFMFGNLAVSPVDDSMVIAVNFEKSIDIHGQHFTGTDYWNGLITVIDDPL